MPSSSVHVRADADAVVLVEASGRACKNTARSLHRGIRNDDEEDEDIDIDLVLLRTFLLWLQIYPNIPI